MYATLANMKALSTTMRGYACSVFAYNEWTGEQYSANPGDYWFLADDDCLTDSEGFEMILAYEFRNIVPL